MRNSLAANPVLELSTPPSQPAFSERITRPLRKGFRELTAFLAPYLAAMRDGRITTPTLAASLNHLAAHTTASAPLGSLPRDCRCLLQGYSTPDNAPVLRDFLKSLGIAAPRLWAVDLYDLRAIYDELGIPQPEMDFCVADATALPADFPAGGFDLVVQDFLFNCLPPSHYPRLLAETSLTIFASPQLRIIPDRIPL